MTVTIPSSSPWSSQKQEKCFQISPRLSPPLGSYTYPPACGFQWSVLSTAQPAESLRSSVALPAQGPLGQNERLYLQSQWHHHKPSIVVTNDIDCLLRTWCPKSGGTSLALWNPLTVERSCLVNELNRIN